MHFVTLIPVGPGEKELERLTDLLASLYHFEASAGYRLVLVNDGNAADSLSRLAERYSPSGFTIVTNPRNGTGEPWTDGLTVGVLAGLRSVARDIADAAFVLKLDTDSLVINPFSNKVHNRFREQPDVGMLGTYLRLPSGAPTNSISVWTPRLLRLQRAFALWRHEQRLHLQISFWGRARRIKQLITLAQSYGYSLGESCIGGGYAISDAALRKICEAGWLEDPCLFLHRPITEDVVVSLLARAAGFDLADFNGRNEPFGVQWRGLCDSPPELLRNGYSIIHSIKDPDGGAEEEAREFFARDRNSRQPSEPSE